MPGPGPAGLVDLAGEPAQVLGGGREGQVGSEGVELAAQIRDGGLRGAVEDGRAGPVEGEAGGDHGAEGGGQEKGDDQPGPQTAGRVPPKSARGEPQRWPRPAHSGPNR